MAFEKWPMLNRCLEQGSLTFIDCAFAESALKKINGEKQEHAALLAVLFALSRQGHMALDISHDGLQFALQLLGFEDRASIAQLIALGATSFPPEGISEGVVKIHFPLYERSFRRLQNNRPRQYLRPDIDHRPIILNPLENLSHLEGKQFLNTLSDNECPRAWICRLGNYHYLQKNWVYESEILKSLLHLSEHPPAIALSSVECDPRMNTAQRQAIELSLKNSLTLITGGPGTGKTFTAAELVKVCLTSCPGDQRSSFRILLTAPTGKAIAQLEGNLRRAVKEEAKVRAGTLHAILGIKAHAYEEEDITPLFADLIIVDECSMIDAKIFSRLLRSVRNGTRLVLIGDKDQLPPVEAGSIFADLLDSGRFPGVHLVECLRSDRSEILALAQAVKEGQADAALQMLVNPQAIDVSWSDLNASTQQCEMLWDRYGDRYSASYKEKPLPEELLGGLGKFSLLSCMRQGPLGVDAVNRYFLHQSMRRVSQDTWWVAPIMITRNDHALELYNGDVGFLVRKVTSDFSLRLFYIDDYALFSDRKGGYRQITALALNAYEYSYCISVHKSQGSEYDEAVVLMPEGSELFGREVLYTAITRARRKVIVAANQELLRKAIAFSSRKISGLGVRLSSF